MADETFVNKLRSFFGYRVEPPKNDFRNPIWGSDDDDDGDELYARQQIDSHLDVHRELTRQVHDMFRSFGGVFGDMKSFFHDDVRSFFSGNEPFEFAGAGGMTLEPPSGHPDNFNSNSIRDFYLKPGYNTRIEEQRDIDLDGKLSSQEISGLLKTQDDSATNTGPMKPFDATLVPGRSFCKTIITTSVTKPDGSIETRRIVKSGNNVIEETTTSSGPDLRGPQDTGPRTISSGGIILSELASLFRNFY